MIAVTGATGNNGIELIKELYARRATVRAVVHNRAHAQAIDLPGVELVEADFDRPTTFGAAVKGADRLFLLMPSSAKVEEQQMQFVDAARRNGVRHIVKLSQFGAALNSAGRFQRYHAAEEEYIRESGLAYTFLRPNLFMQGLLNFRPTISSQGIFFAAAQNARVSAVDVRDIAAVAAAALTESGHEGETYELTGPEAITHDQMAEMLSEATRMPIKYVDVPPAALLRALLDLGMPDWQAAGVVEEYGIYRSGEASKVTNTVLEVTGATPRSFLEFATDYSAEFRPKTVGVA